MKGRGVVDASPHSYYHQGMTPDANTLRLFSAYGIEAEYMIVDRETLSVKPLADEVLKAMAGAYTSDVEFGRVGWSNELVLHVIEIKCNGPRPRLEGLDQDFLSSVHKINEILAPMNAMLLPTAMHPWMDPLKESKLWPHDSATIYEAYDKVFGCRGHGWSNLQSVHINLPFANDEEFGRLHAAVRLVLPLIPALAASSPIVEGRPPGMMDTRIDFYRRNQARVPMLTGDVVPEPVFTEKDYREQIFNEIYRAIKPHDPDGLLQFEWLNSRGAIARFDRNAIEIRLVDIQESPRADLAIVSLVSGTVKALAEGVWTEPAEQRGWAAAPLRDLLFIGVKEGSDAIIHDPAYLRMFGVEAPRMSARELWQHIAAVVTQRQDDPTKSYINDIKKITTRGCLSRSILKALNGDFARASLKGVYRSLAECLAGNTFFR